MVQRSSQFDILHQIMGQWVPSLTPGHYALPEIIRLEELADGIGPVIVIGTDGHGASQW